VKAEVREYDRLFSDEAPDSHADKDFMEFINPDSLKLITAFIEPSLTEAHTGDRFQFQRLGYFNVDTDSSSEKIIFNKIVGLRDTWAKQKPKAQQQNNAPKQNNNPQQGAKAINTINKLGKKYTNLPEEKQVKVRADILELAKDVTYEELEPLFATAVKKVGTRIAAMLILNVKLAEGLTKNEAINDFIAKALEDKNELLVAEAKAIK